MEWLTWATIKALLKRIPWQVWAVLLLTGAVWAYGEWKEAEGRAEVQRKFDAHLSADRGAEAVAKQRARIKEAQDRELFAEAGKNFLEAKDEARRLAGELAAAVLAGDVRLQKHWRCEAGDRAEVAGPAEVADGDAALRAASAGRIIGIGREADAQVKGLQELLRIEREKPRLP